MENRLKILKTENLEELQMYFSILNKFFPYLREKIKKEYLEMKIKNKRGMILKAVKNKKELGFSVWLEENPQTAYIWWLLVFPKYRKKGIGEALIRETLFEIEKRKYKKVWAKIKNDNFPTLILCLKFHFYIKGISIEENIPTVMVEKNIDRMAPLSFILI